MATRRRPLPMPAASDGPMSKPVGEREGAGGGGTGTSQSPLLQPVDTTMAQQAGPALAAPVSHAKETGDDNAGQNSRADSVAIEPDRSRSPSPSMGSLILPGTGLASSVAFPSGKPRAKSVFVAGSGSSASPIPPHSLTRGPSVVSISRSARDNASAPPLLRRPSVLSTSSLLPPDPPQSPRKKPADWQPLSDAEPSPHIHQSLNSPQLQDGETMGAAEPKAVSPSEGMATARKQPRSFRPPPEPEAVTRHAAPPPPEIRSPKRKEYLHYADFHSDLADNMERHQRLLREEVDGAVRNCRPARPDDVVSGTTLENNVKCRFCEFVLDGSAVHQDTGAAVRSSTSHAHSAPSTTAAPAFLNGDQPYFAAPRLVALQRNTVSSAGNHPYSPRARHQLAEQQAAVLKGEKEIRRRRVMNKAMQIASTPRHGSSPSRRSSSGVELEIGEPRTVATGDAIDIASTTMFGEAARDVIVANNVNSSPPTVAHGEQPWLDPRIDHLNHVEKRPRAREFGSLSELLRAWNVPAPVRHSKGDDNVRNLMPRMIRLHAETDNAFKAEVRRVRENLDAAFCRLRDKASVAAAAAKAVLDSRTSEQADRTSYAADDGASSPNAVGQGATYISVHDVPITDSARQPVTVDWQTLTAIDMSDAACTCRGDNALEGHPDLRHVVRALVELMVKAPEIGPYLLPNLQLGRSL